MKFQFVIIALFVMMLIPVCSATPSDQINEMIEISTSIEDWRTYEDFNGNVQLYVDNEPFYMTVENKTIELYEGETESYEYEIITTEDDLKDTKELMQKFSDNGKLGVFDSIKLFYLFEKTSIFNENSVELKTSSKIGMSTTWLA